MKRILIRSVVALGLISGFVMSVPRVAAQELPRAEDVLDKAAVAVADKAAFQKIKTVVKKAKVSVQGMEGRYVEYSAAADKFYKELTIEGLLNNSGGLHGEVAWEKSSITGARLLLGGEMTDTIRDADIHAARDWRKYYKEAKIVGEEKVAGKPAYKVDLTTHDGAALIFHYDKQSGLLVRQESNVESAQGKSNIVVFLSDYSKVDGILYPFTTKILVGPVEVVLTIDRIDHNVDIPEERFALPTDVNKLVTKQKK
jgi:zinc protease